MDSLQSLVRWMQAQKSMINLLGQCYVDMKTRGAALQLVSWLTLKPSITHYFVCVIMTAVSRLNPKAVLDAAKRIKDKVPRTPIVESSYFNRATGCNVYFKCENLQKVWLNLYYEFIFSRSFRCQHKSLSDRQESSSSEELRMPSIYWIHRSLRW